MTFIPSKWALTASVKVQQLRFDAGNPRIDSWTQVRTETNKHGVKTTLSSDSWFGYLSSISLIQESKLDALEKWAFDVEAEAWTGKREIWVCFPLGYTTKDREYFKMPPSFRRLLDSFGLSANEHGGAQTLLSASLGSLYNVFIDFSLGVTGDTSALARAKKDLSHLSP